MSLPFRVHVAFSAWGWPCLALAVTDGYGSFQELPCSLTQKNEEAPGRCRAQAQLYKTAGDDRVVRLICSSGEDTEDSGDHCPDQTSLSDSGRAAIGFGANIKIPLFILLSELFIFCSL